METARSLRSPCRGAIGFGRLRGVSRGERLPRPAPTGAEALHFVPGSLFVPAGTGTLHNPSGTAPRFCACGGWASEARPDPTVKDIEFYPRAIWCHSFSLRGGSGHASGEGIVTEGSRTAIAQPYRCAAGHRDRQRHSTLSPVNDPDLFARKTGLVTSLERRRRNQPTAEIRQK